MPRIDPLQLLKCLSVLLTPDGGILSRDEVPRLVNLMTKFSKKLVSKCVYVLILKNTSKELVDMFMAEGGWTLIQTWLQDAVQTANWHLVKEILGLLLITPVDVERLKLNILPKLIKSLSRRDDVQDVAALSSQLVKQWLVIVKGTSSLAQGQLQMGKVEVVKSESESEIEKNISDGIDIVKFYKKDSKDEVTSPKNAAEIDEPAEAEEPKDVEMKDVSEEKSKSEEKIEDKSKSKSSSKSSSSSRDRDKEKSRDRDRYRDKGRSKSSSSSKSKSSSRDKDRKDRDKDRKGGDKDRKDGEKDRSKSRDKSRSNGAIKSSSSSHSTKDKKESDSNSKKEKSDKDKSEKDKKSSIDAFKPPSLEKLGRIPKKTADGSNTETGEVKKKAFSIGIRKDASSEERPKTVKVFNSKMRSTGLEEEAKPAPSRIAPQKKTVTPPSLPPLPLKRLSPPRDARDPVSSEKKIKLDKIDIPDRPGAIKLIPPKPKPMLQESDLFNNALTAATSKKETKKRKRKPSISKETPTSPSTSPSHDSATTTTQPATQDPASPPIGLKNIAPINFYQDTLSEENKETPEENGIEEHPENLDESVASITSENKENEISSPRAVTPTEDDPEEIKKMNIDGGIKGVLLYSKRKGPKKSISWKNDNDLVEIKYFELDETERVNVTKAFNDMAKMDISNEREALQLCRKVGGEDLMETQIRWRIPFEIELPDPLVTPGSRSLEKDIQFAREKSVLQALYFDKRKIPDSPEEPIPENHQMSDPVIITLEDPDSHEIDLRTTPWPEPKGNAPLPEPQMPMVYPNMQVPFNPQFNTMPPTNFPNMAPRFPVPGGPMVPQVPNNFVPPNIMPNDMMGPPNMMAPNDLMMNQMNPNMYQGGGPMSDGYGPGPGPEPDFPMYGNPNGPPNNMFPPNHFRDNRLHHRGGFRRGGRGGGKDNGNWVRMKDSRGGGGGGGNNWRRGGGGNRGGRLCKNIQNHGYCRNGDNCAFIHP
ncbi:serine/threonine-protein phosphatase 1 regulatory subunit 10-like isoform X2 [Diorhabda sublineata]|uniref:serine/threonine-protein phosphatase 1 regulatory subunit 10-like isoform X2 n=1 Tax=Diorhabda sublineata TaxID=1163346 RepID=UPI0024E0ECF5|nr:serine/threonine-protein phosphatase 1 regulatory subunit 10-like isoform X2 [Diorhabda sublineata]